MVLRLQEHVISQEDFKSINEVTILHWRLRQAMPKAVIIQFLEKFPVFRFPFYVRFSYLFCRLTSRQGPELT